MSLSTRLPIPQSLATECAKGARILNSFIRPGQSVDKFIPQGILEKAKGIAFLTVLKAGFIWSGRIGSGLVVARLPDGNWSAPSAIGLMGAGVGGQIGAELTDFVMILTTDSAVRAFSHGGNVTLGANLGVSAGPWGRSAEASGALINLAPVVSYSRSKGLFAGVSLEGSAIIGRKDANEKLYGRKISAEQLLRGEQPPPPEAAPLYRALNLKATPMSTEFNTPADSMYSPSVGATPGPYGGTSNYGTGSPDIGPGVGAGAAGVGASPLDRSVSYLNRPIDSNDNFKSPGYGATSGYTAPDNYGAMKDYGSSSNYGASSSHAGAASTNYGASSNYGGTATYDAAPPYDHGSSSYNSTPIGDHKGAAHSKAPPPPPPHPKLGNGNKFEEYRVVALYDFDGEQDGDLSFKRHDLITVVGMSETEDWWIGTCNGRRGVFPSNYVSRV
ncbi:hypothetical protein GGI11_001675 [Coemansia sp. RSA 2049]|nr:hypothetical protein H4217_002648 [Coemansia sp. RSA 1939]KAJ2522664.1 hypothetical protein GGI11_001675 [Coemansia sp. RSA 2049]